MELRTVLVPYRTGTSTRIVEVEREREGIMVDMHAHINLWGPSQMERLCTRQYTYIPYGTRTCTSTRTSTRTSGRAAMSYTSGYEYSYEYGGEGEPTLATRGQPWWEVGALESRRPGRASSGGGPGRIGPAHSNIQYRPRTRTTRMRATTVRVLVRVESVEIRHPNIQHPGHWSMRLRSRPDSLTSAARAPPDEGGPTPPARSLARANPNSKRGHRLILPFDFSRSVRTGPVHVSSWEAQRISLRFREDATDIQPRGDRGSDDSIVRYEYSYVYLYLYDLSVPRSSTSDCVVCLEKSEEDHRPEFSAKDSSVRCFLRPVLVRFSHVINRPSYRGFLLRQESR